MITKQVQPIVIIILFLTFSLFSPMQILAGPPSIPAPPSKETLDALKEAGRQNEETYGAWPEDAPLNVKSSGETGLKPEENIKNAKEEIRQQAQPSINPTIVPTIEDKVDQASAEPSIAPMESKKGYVNTIRYRFSEFVAGSSKPEELTGFRKLLYSFFGE